MSPAGEFGRHRRREPRRYAGTAPTATATVSIRIPASPARTTAASPSISNRSVGGACRRDLQLDDGALDPQPDRAALVILPLPEFIRALRCDNLCILSMLTDQQGRSAPDVDVGDHVE